MAESTFFSLQPPLLITQFTWADSLNIYFTVWCQLSNYGRELLAPGSYWIIGSEWLLRGAELRVLTARIRWISRAGLRSN